jgi:hypothetical protein
MKFFEFYKIMESKSSNVRYINRYLNFISRYINQPKIKQLTECHHILPKSSDLFPEYSNFKLFSWNCINLTKRQHWIAHWMLHKIFGGKQSQAFFRMCKKVNGFRVTSRTYELAKIEHCKIAAEFCRNREWTDLQRKSASEKSKGNKNAFGKKRTDEQNKNASLRLTGIKHTSEQNRQKSIRQTGNIVKQETKNKISITLTGYKHNPQTKLKQSIKKRKYYEVTSPNGEIHYVFGLNSFCKEHLLNSGNMHQVALGKCKNHKGWFVKKIDNIIENN